MQLRPGDGLLPAKGAGPGPVPAGPRRSAGASPLPQGDGGSAGLVGASAPGLALLCPHPLRRAAPHLSRPCRPSHAATAPHTPLLSSLLPVCSFCRQATPSAGNQPAAANAAVVTVDSLLLLPGAQRAGPGCGRWLFNLPQARGSRRPSACGPGRGGAGRGDTPTRG